MCVLCGGYVAILNFTVYPFVAPDRDLSWAPVNIVMNVLAS